MQWVTKLKNGVNGVRAGPNELFYARHEEERHWQDEKDDARMCAENVVLAEEAQQRGVHGRTRRTQNDSKPASTTTTTT
jgi:hypothetical protein